MVDDFFEVGCKALELGVNVLYHLVPTHGGNAVLHIFYVAHSNVTLNAPLSPFLFIFHFLLAMLNNLLFETQLRLHANIKQNQFFLR